MPSDFLGPAHPRLVLYLPHRPEGLEQLAKNPSAPTLIANNSNHWRKIVTLLAKIACPDAGDWRRFRDEDLFRQTSLCFVPKLVDTAAWHWIGGRDNLRRFGNLHHRALPLATSPDICIDPDQRLLLTPYPDYRQLSNTKIDQIRFALDTQGFYSR